MDIIQLKLKEDLLDKCMEYRRSIKNQCELKDSQFEEPFDEWIEEKINKLVSEHQLTFTPTNQINPCKCMARTWNKGQGEKQCTHLKKDGDYCDKHKRMLQYEEVLRFGDIRNEKPKYDLIKQKNGKLEELQWVSPDPIEAFQKVLDIQSRKVIYASKNLDS